ncbi:HAD hydrolase-like protein [Conchiformibius steedae DSM 2580]|uniref:HAD hydrolase-like protein n=2 Tax=Conchiformibius steedae TaxID=153493 RepID=A0AAE9HU06_9NEIS|nr:NIF family HAD-type phosphatase [Conchiformibius steedae]QMT32971.1 HAD hydrolase-like protein [Conchiformibius steedae]URD67594.1 HAD hydrolase-like protein [Conchiformibius steedae DSM 2580]
MDGTLVSSDTANNLAYQEAIFHYYPNSSPLTVKRITAETIKINYPKQSNQIITYKQKVFPNFLSQITVNTDLTNFIHIVHSHIPVYLISHSLEQRARQILTHLQLNNLFKATYFCDKSQAKYPFMIRKLRLNPNQVVIFDDNLNELQYASQCNIPTSQLFFVTFPRI